MFQQFLENFAVYGMALIRAFFGWPGAIGLVVLFAILLSYPVYAGVTYAPDGSGDNQGSKEWNEELKLDEPWSHHIFTAIALSVGVVIFSGTLGLHDYDASSIASASLPWILFALVPPILRRLWLRKNSAVEVDDR